MPNVFPHLARLLALVVCFTCSVAAQTSRVAGGFQGLVVDESGAVIPGATVIIEQPEQGFRRRTTTDASGRFVIHGLPSEKYAVRVEKDGFSTALLSDVEISLGRTHSERIELKPAAVIESIEVIDRAGAVDATSTTSSAALGSERIEEGPSANRNYLNFVLVAPGVALSNGSNAQRSLAGIRGAAVDSGFTFGGMRGRNNSLSIDGVDNRDETTGGNRVAIGLEMVQEFRVAGAVVGVGSGGAGGSVDVVTRSGNNTWHGDLTWFFQNEALNARNPEVTSGPEPRFRRYQPGVSLLGPIRRDRTFFATALEQEWETSQEWSDTPGEALETIRRTLRSPQFKFAAVGSAVQGLFPASSSETEFIFKLNHYVGTKHALSARYAFSRGGISNEVHGLQNFADRSARGSSLTRDHSFVASLTSVPRPNLVNDLRVQAARRDVELTPNSGGPMLHIPGVVTLGRAYNLDSDRTENHWEIVEAVNVVAGSHQLSFGGSIHRVSLDARLGNRFGGIFTFPGLDDFALARPDVFLQAFGSPGTDLSTLPVNAWAQDSWQLRTGLTLDAGVRWDAQRLPRPIPDAAADVAPRIGIAWTPSQRRSFVLRAGGGLFYDRSPLAFLNDAVQKDGISGFEYYLVGAEAARILSLAQGGSLAGPIEGEPTLAYVPSPDFPSTRSRKLTAGLEQGLGRSTKLVVEFALVRGFHLPRVRNILGSLPPLYQLEQTARSNHRGVSVSIQRRFVREVAFLVAYNYGGTWDDASDFDEHPSDPLDLRRDWALSAQHQQQRLAASGLFELPVDDWESGPKWLRESLQDFVVSPIFTFGSGRPTNALSTTDVFRTGAFPISARPEGLGRNPFLGPKTVTLDLRLMKGFWVKEGRAILQTGVEAFNLLNHSNPLRVSPFYAAGSERLGSYREPLETLNARQIQLMVQFEY